MWFSWVEHFRTLRRILLPQVLFRRTARSVAQPGLRIGGCIQGCVLNTEEAWPRENRSRRRRLTPCSWPSRWSAPAPKAGAGHRRVPGQRWRRGSATSRCTSTLWADSRTSGSSPIRRNHVTDAHFYSVTYQYPRKESLSYRRNSKKVLDRCGVERENRFGSIDRFSKPTLLRKVQAL